MNAKAKKRTIALVNAYDLGNLLPGLFHEQGFNTVHVQSEEVIIDLFAASFRPRDFIDNIIFDGDLAACAEKLKQHDVELVLAGHEYGVDLAEALGGAIGQPSNDPKTTNLRRNKFDMIAAMQKAELAAPEQKICTSLDELLEFFRTHQKMIVSKPLDSASNDNVCFSKSEQEIEDAFKATYNNTGLFGKPIGQILAQTYTDGREFMINTVSRCGVHHVTDIWEKSLVSVNGTLELPEAAFLRPCTGHPYEELVDYTFKCLDVLGVTDTAAHVEVRYAHQGPTIIEIGARRGGGQMCRVANLGLDASQHDWIVKSCTDKERFLAEAGQPYTLHQTVAVTILVAQRTGILRELKRTERFKALPTFQEFVQIVGVGEKITTTINDYSYPAAIILADPDVAAVERDARTIRFLDEDANYVIQS